jgi:REP element-mobilizing transposase RayT
MVCILSHSPVLYGCLYLKFPIAAMPYKWFDHLKEKGHYIIGYVIMPNHAHAIIAFHNTGKTINSIVGNGKRFIAYSIIDNLEKLQQQNLLLQLQRKVNATQKC